MTLAVGEAVAVSERALAQGAWCGAVDRPCGVNSGDVSSLSPDADT
jgi:hypothetical protein